MDDRDVTMLKEKIDDLRGAVCLLSIVILAMLAMFLYDAINSGQGLDYILWAIVLVPALLLALYCSLTGYQTPIKKPEKESGAPAGT